MITKEKIATIAFKIAMVLLLLLMLAFTFGCGSKKKLIQKTQFSTEIATVARVNELTQKEIKIDITTVKVKEENNVSVQENFIGEVADSSKDATLTIENLNGTKVYRYTNFKNVSSGSKTSETKSKDSLGQNLSKIDKSKDSKDSEAETKGKASGKKKEIDLKVERGFPWHWVILAVLLYSIFSYFGKSFNPLKWISKI